MRRQPDTRRFWRSVAVVMICGLATLTTAGCSSGSAKKLTGNAVKTTNVDLPRSYRFDPAIITTRSGSTVTWTNHDNFTHNVHFQSGPDTKTHVLKPGTHVSITFPKAGTYRYECTFHPQDMQGKVIVT